MNKNDFLKTFNKPGDLDLAGLNDLNKRLQDLKNKPKEDALEQLLELKSSIELFIKVAPPIKQMLNPYLDKVNKGIVELKQIQNNEKQ